MGLGTKITPTPALSESSWVICLENTPTMQEVMHAYMYLSVSMHAVQETVVFYPFDYLAYSVRYIWPACQGVQNNLHVYTL